MTKKLTARDETRAISIQVELLHSIRQVNYSHSVGEFYDQLVQAVV